MKLFVVSLVFLIASALDPACESGTKLPVQMPDDLKVVLVERSKDGPRISYSIDASTLEVGRGGGWHNRSTTTTRIPREAVEKLYEAFRQNRFDRIENFSSSDNHPVDRDLSITVSFGPTSITVYDGLFHLSPEDGQRFESVRQAVLDVAKLEKPPSE